MTLTRREFGVASFAALALSKTAWAAAPLADMPAGAIDCHNHIVGPLAKYPMARPIAQKGSEPATRVSNNFADTKAGRCTPPKANPISISASTSMALKVIAIRTLAEKYANNGMGLARFTCSHPRPRSAARPASVPKSDAPITPNVPYEGIK